MRLISYRQDAKVGVGVMADDERFVPLPEAAPELPRTLKGLLEMGTAARTVAQSAEPTLSIDKNPPRPGNSGTACAVGADG